MQRRQSLVLRGDILGYETPFVRRETLFRNHNLFIYLSRDSFPLLRESIPSVDSNTLPRIRGYRIERSNGRETPFHLLQELFPFVRDWFPL